MGKKKTTTKNHFIYRDKTGRYRWRIVSKNHQIIGASSQSFVEHFSAKRNLLAVKKAINKLVIK